MIKKKYNIFPKLDGEVVNFITNDSSKIYKDNILVSNFPLGDFSRYVNDIGAGFYIENSECKFVGVSYFIEEDYTVVTSDLGDCIKFDSSNKTSLSIAAQYNYNTITAVAELTDDYNYLFFVWDDKWDIVYKQDVDEPGVVWSDTLVGGYYVLCLNTSNAVTVSIDYGTSHTDYLESLVVFYAEGDTTITVAGSGTWTFYLRSLGVSDTLVKTTSNGLYIYSKKTKLGPFKLPTNTPCVLDFEYFINGGDTDIYVYCNYFLIGFGKLVGFNLDKNKPISFNLTSIDVLSTINSMLVYNFGLFISKVPGPASVYDICSRSISSPVLKANVSSDDNLYIYKTDFSVWVLDYYNDAVMVLYGDNLKKSTITCLYNNLIHTHGNYTTVSYGFSSDTYRIVDVLYNDGIFILLLTDRVVIIDKFGTVLKYIYCKNISKLFYIDNYVLFYDKTRARLYRIYSNDFKTFEFPSIIIDVDFSTKFKICCGLSPFDVVNNDYVSVVKEQSIFGYAPLYDYFSVRTYTVGSHTDSNLTFEYDLTQNATVFTGITTVLGYRVFANNPIETGMTVFTLFVSIKPMSLEFKRYITRIPGVLDMYTEDGILKVELKCGNADISVDCACTFNVNAWYDIYVTYHSSTGLYIYVNGYESGKTEVDYDTGGISGGKYISIGGYGFDSYAAYKFKGFIRNNFFISRSFITKEKAFDLHNNGVKDPKTFSEYNTYVNAYGVTSLSCIGDNMFVGTYGGLHIYETSTFKLVKTVGDGNIISNIDVSGDLLFANVISLPESGKISGSSGDVVKLPGELFGKIFVSNENVCNCCVYNGNTYVNMLGSTAYMFDISKYFGEDTIHGYYNLGKFAIDQLNTEIQLVGEYGYDEQLGCVIADDYMNSSFKSKVFDFCDEMWGGVTAYGESNTSIISYNDKNNKTNYDILVDVKYSNESRLAFNLFDIVVDLNYILLSADPYEYTYTFIMSRLGNIKFPYEVVLLELAEYFAPSFNILPSRLYHSENDLLGLSEIKFNFEVSEDNFKLLKNRKLKVLENNIETATRFAYDFRGGLGNGVKHRIEDNTVFGSFDGSSYFINSSFDDTPVWNFTAEFIFRISSYKEFNPLFSKSTKAELSYGLALCNGDLKFLFGRNGVNSILDLGVSINLNQWTFLGIYVSDTYIDVLINGSYSRVLFYGIPDVVESELYVGFGISLNSRASNFIGDMLYFDINKDGHLHLLNTDYAIYTGSKAGSTVYDEVISLEDYYNLDYNTFSLTSMFYSDPQSPLSRLFRLYNFYMIGSDTEGSITEIETDSIFSSSISNKILKVNTATLDYEFDSFSSCSDFAYDFSGGLYNITNNETIKYSSEDISKINKLENITTIKYTNNLTLFGTFAGIIKINNILTNNPTKQRWLFDNGINDLLITDEYVYIASGKYLTFVQVKYLVDSLEQVITRKPMGLYTADDIIKSIVYYDGEIHILVGSKIINTSDGSVLYDCGDARYLFTYGDDILIIYNSYIKRVSDEKIILEIRGKITDITCGSLLTVSTNSGFYTFDEETDSFNLNIVGMVGMLKDFTLSVSDYCYHVYIHGDNVVYIYRDFEGIKLIEFNIETKIVINNVILFDLIDGSFSDYVPYTLDSVGEVSE